MDWSEFINLYQVVMVKVVSEEDYFAVKQEERPPLDQSADFIPVPVKYIRITSCGGIKWSMNRFGNLSSSRLSSSPVVRVASEASDPVLQRSLEIRKSENMKILKMLIDAK